MALRERQASGLEYLDLVTALLQRVRLADPTAGVWEAADLQWWWRRDQHPDPAGQTFWFLDDADDPPVAGVIFTDWGDRWGCDLLGAGQDASDVLETTWPAARRMIDERRDKPIEVVVRDDESAPDRRGREGRVRGHRRGGDRNVDGRSPPTGGRAARRGVRAGRQERRRDAATSHDPAQRRAGRRTPRRVLALSAGPGSGGVRGERRPGGVRPVLGRRGDRRRTRRTDAHRTRVPADGPGASRAHGGPGPLGACGMREVQGQLPGRERGVAAPVPGGRLPSWVIEPHVPTIQSVDPAFGPLPRFALVEARRRSKRRVDDADRRPASCRTGTG